MKNTRKNLEIRKKTITILIINYKKQKRLQNIQKKQYELNKRRILIRKQNESIREIKQMERRQKRQISKDEDFDLGRFSELATSHKIYVNNLNLHENENEILQDYTGDFELYGLMIMGHVQYEASIRFKKMDHFESYINAIDIDYDSEDVNFTGYIYKVNTTQFNVVKQSAYSKGTHYKQEIVEKHGQNYYIPTSGMCFIKCNKYFTRKDYTEEFSTFIRTEQKRSNVMTSARSHPFCRKYNTNIGLFDGTRINPRKITQRITALKIHNNLFCLIWKSNKISFDHVIEDELKPNFKVHDILVSDKLVKTFIKHEYNPKKVKSSLTNIVVNDLETFKKIQVPYCSCIYKLIKI